MLKAHLCGRNIFHNHFWLLAISIVLSLRRFSCQILLWMRVFRFCRATRRLCVTAAWRWRVPSRRLHRSRTALLLPRASVSGRRKKSTRRARRSRSASATSSPAPTAPESSATATANRAACSRQTSLASTRATSPATTPSGNTRSVYFYTQKNNRKLLFFVY